MGNRRPIGALVLIVALLTLLAVTALSRPGLPGTPSAAPPPGPPTVGQCVLASVAYPSSTPGRSPQLVYPQATTGPCRGNRYAEVAAILTDPVPPPPASPGDNPYGPDTIDVGDDRNLDACAAGIHSYLGAPVGAPIVGGWQDSWATPSPSVIAPSARQQAAGQHWLACIIGPSTDALPFDYSVRGAYTESWPPADGFSSCFLGGPTRDTTLISCDGPHGGEVFGWNYDNPGATDLNVACAKVVAATTGMTDPTGGGRLTVQFTDTTQGAQCAVVVTDPTEKLGHSLRHLGTRPVPWS